MSHISPIAEQYLRLHVVPGLGAIGFGRLMEAFGSIDAVAQASVRELAGVERISPAMAQRIRDGLNSAEAVREEIALAGRLGVRIICREDPHFPSLLRHVSDPPAVLYVRGELLEEDQLALAVVGMRDPSRYGIEQAASFAQAAAMAGLCVVSGLARGIDTAAHEAALRVRGRTLAILGCGLVHLYPPESTELANAITRSGALISDFPLNTPPARNTFPVRNRLIAGMSLGTLVIEGTTTSGAMITARLAIDYGREVFAIPGPVNSRCSEGPNRLIQRGEAAMVLNFSDLLDGLRSAGHQFAEAPAPPPGPATPASLFDGPASPENASSPAQQPARPALPPLVLSTEETVLLKAMGQGRVDVDSLLDHCELPIATVMSTLATLQIKGLIRQLAGGVFERRRPGET